MILDPIAAIIVGFAFFSAILTGLLGLGYGLIFVRTPSIDNKFLGLTIIGFSLLHIMFPVVGMVMTYQGQPPMGLIVGVISLVFSFLLVWFAPGILEDGKRVYSGQKHRAISAD